MKLIKFEKVDILMVKKHRKFTVLEQEKEATKQIILSPGISKLLEVLFFCRRECANNKETNNEWIKGSTTKISATNWMLITKDGNTQQIKQSELFDNTKFKILSAFDAITEN